MRSPLRHHNNRHRDTGVPFEQCWVCERDRAICQSKIRFASWAEADDWVRDLNEGRAYEPPVVTRYPCRWCDQWHMKTAKDVRTRARMERQRRKWLAARGRPV